MRTIRELDATGPDVVVGRHAIWSPRHGVKVPFQWGGRVTKYGKAEPSYLPGDSLPSEVAILRALAALGMAPPVGEWVYIETLITNHPGGWHADPCGAYGYEMTDATSLPPGRFDLEAMRALPIEGTPNAWGDVMKPGNVVNGYLVDVRRSGWDLLRWKAGAPMEWRPIPPTERIVDNVTLRCQFPKGQRETAYQDFYLGGAWQRGERRIVERAELLGFAPGPGETVLEIGCQAGGFLQLAALRGAGTVLGVEVDADYIDCGRMLARDARQNICFRKLDAVGERETLLAWLAERCLAGVDHLLCLSMEKHLGEEAMFSLIDAIGARTTYLETNAVSEANPWKLRAEVEARGGVHVGDSTDRNLRRLYRIGRTAP